MRYTLLFFCLVLMSFVGKSQGFSERYVEEKRYSFIPQSRMMGGELQALPSCLPKNIGKDGDLIVSKSNCWCRNSYITALRCLQLRSNDSNLKQLTLKKTACIETEKTNRITSDLCFMMYCDVSNGFRPTGDGQSKEELISALKPLCNRYHSKVKAVILSTLSSLAYGVSESDNDILLNSMVSVPHNFKVDVPLSYVATTCSSAIKIEKKL